jgi:GNAT superfamily N-acetyltransferase
MTDRLLAYARHKVHPLVRVWLSAETIERNLRHELEGDLERLRSDALAAEFGHHCPVAETNAEDYKNRLLKVGGLELLTGIRFLGLDLAQPLVDVMYQSEATLTSEQLSDIQDASRQEFAVFRPKRVRFYVPSQLPRFSQDGDKQLIAAPLGVMLAQPGPGTVERVRLERATTLTFYPDYTAIYRQLRADYPELQAVTRAESQADMQAYLEDGYLFEIFVDGAWAGVTAVFRDTNTGLSGFCVAEIVLAKAFRAQGLGSAVQLKLAAQLLSQGTEPTEILFGTVGDVNIPARRTALRAGRVDLGGHVWLPL